MVKSSPVAEEASVVEDAKSDDAFSSPPDIAELVKAEVNSAVGAAVANALAVQLPTLIQIVKEQGDSIQPQFPQGMGPAQNVPMSIAPIADIKVDYIKHYRLDDTVSGKFQELDMSLVEAGMDINDAVIKGSWIHFANGHFYANTENQVKYLDWKISTQPHCKIYVDEGSGVIPCTVVNCAHTFVNEKGLLAHLRATHGVANA